MSIIGMILAGFGVLVMVSVRRVVLDSIDRDLIKQAEFVPASFSKLTNLKAPPNASISVKAVIAKGDNLKAIEGALSDAAALRTSSRRSIEIKFVDASKKSSATGIFFSPEASRLASAGVVGPVTMNQGNAPFRVYLTKMDSLATGYVQLSTPLGEMEALLASLRTVLLVLIPGALLATGFGAWMLSLRAMKPVREMNATASAIEASDLSKRLPEQGSDEFSQLSHTFNAMLERLETSFVKLELSVEQQRQFVADASHELRSPLTVIQATSGWSLSKSRPEADYRESLSTIGDSAKRMDKLIADLLSLARSDAGKLCLNIKPNSPQLLADLALSQTAQDSAQPEIALHIDATVSTVVCDLDGIARVISNLLSNALRYTPHDGRIELRIERIEKGTLISVSDSGCGIAQEHLSQLGTRFFRVDDSRTRESGGTGLGLAICKEIVSGHGGILNISSTVGEGTLAEVVLPKS